MSVGNKAVAKLKGYSKKLTAVVHHHITYQVGNNHHILKVHYNVESNLYNKVNQLENVSHH